MTKFISAAIREAENADNKAFWHAAIVYSGGKIIAKACNKSVIFCHAEINSLIRLCRLRLQKKICNYKLLVVRINNEGHLLNSEPCKLCTYIIQSFGIKSITYSSDQGKLVKTKPSNLLGCHITKGLRDYDSYIISKKINAIKSKLNLIKN